jgi:5'(3')-deoxyribonucleotidase
MIDEINAKISNGEKLLLGDYVSLAANIERELIDKIKKGDPSIFKRDKIKNEKSYKQTKEKSTYFHHLLWKEVFEEKYGESGDPIYLVVKVPTVINSKKDMNDYLENLEDTELKDRLVKCMSKYGKEIIGTFRPPAVIVNDSGLPEEIVKAIDVKRIVFDNMNMIYLKLETLGFYRKYNKMISEMGY